MKLITLILAVTLTGCALNPKHSADLAVGADLATTGIGISTSIAVEANPLLTSPAAIVASGLLRWALIHQIDKSPEPQRTQNLSTISAITWGVSASNFMIIAGASNPAGLLIGAITGYAVYQSTADHRLFAESCSSYNKEHDNNAVCKSGVSNHISVQNPDDLK